MVILWIFYVQQTAEEWRIVFYISSGIYLFGCIVYWMWASGEVQPWARLPEQRMNMKTVDKEIVDNQTQLKGYVNDGIRYDE